MTDRKNQRAEIEFKLVRMNPARIPPQQHSARKLVALMRMRQVRVATYLDELIKRNREIGGNSASNEPVSPAPIVETEEVGV